MRHGRIANCQIASLRQSSREEGVEGLLALLEDLPMASTTVRLTLLEIDTYVSYSSDSVIDRPVVGSAFSCSWTVLCSKYYASTTT
jgi:hypothetical protein